MPSGTSTEISARAIFLVQALVLDWAISAHSRTLVTANGSMCARVGGLERREAGGLLFGLAGGVAAGCNEAEDPACRVGPAGA